MPHGWSLAEVDDRIVRDVVGKYPWGTDVMLVANGCGYWCAGTCASGCQFEDKCHIEVTAAGLRPSVADFRILISRPDDGSPRRKATLASALWEEKPFADCEVVCEESTTSCHRAVLAVASPVLKQMLTVQMQEAATGRILLRGTTPSAVESMLRFAYTGAIADDCDHLLDLLALADQYQMPALVSACAEKALNDINDDSIVSIIRALRNHRDSKEVQPVWVRLLDVIAGRKDFLSLVAMSV
eukprot:TRINITY_DN27747_c0_g1_i1.p1 TRINITY_DN27747_c0_g1~~TRINITY_DN27747_c0_g1_i1.p1  ORF type:complete len:242 (+),score=37.46 TRINITY_DN27747_c0_g1_i1:231-956(+)